MLEARDFNHVRLHKQKKAIAAMVEKSRGEYLVSMSDNGGIIDTLAQIRGNEELLMDMITDPEFVEEAVQKLLRMYKSTQEELFSLVTDNNEGSSIAWMQLWSPYKMAQMQCDLSVMISADMYKRFVMSELEEITSYLECPVYHFDGMEQIRHLDALLSLKNLRAIQWTHVAGQPATSEFLPQLQRIQKAGKNLVLFPQAYEVEKLLDNLSSRGLFMMVNGLKNKEEADAMMKLVETHSKVRD